MAADPDHIACWQRLDARTTTSGKLAAADIADLAGIGVRHVINLALVDSPGALADEGELLSALGIRYSHIPVPFSAPQESHFAAFCEALAHRDDPVHVHCIMNWRVSAFFYRYHRDHRDMPESDARALLEKQWSPQSQAQADAAIWARFITRPAG